MEWIFLKNMTYLLCIILHSMQVKCLPYGVCKVHESSVRGKTVLITDCCNHFYKKNKVCAECPIGHTSSRGGLCEKCVDGQFGKKCSELCSCNAAQRCDHVKGCINVTVDDRTEQTNPQLNGNPAEQVSGPDDVVTYMTCVAVGSVLVVVCGLLVKSREAICRRNGSMTAMKNEITKRKRQSVSPGKNSGKDKKKACMRK